MIINEKLEMPYRPMDNYVSTQNPPDFSWPHGGNDVSYDLIICGDKALQNVVYKKDDIITNFFNFPHIFEPGIYYWSVRSKTGDLVGDWSIGRRFLLVPHAHPFPVPDIDTLISRIIPTHPRIYTNEHGIDLLRREILSDQNFYFPVLKSQVMDYLNREFPREESCDALNISSGNMYGPFAYAARNSKIACDMVMLTAFYYLITKDKSVGKFAVENLMKISLWDPDGVTSYRINDQAHRRIALNSALAYDWLYDLTSDSQKAAVLKMIRERTTIMFQSDDFNVSLLSERPFASHGWTAIGYVCIIALAVYNDLEEAHTWIKYTLPLYINRMHPWSNEDGGWAQGTYYWAVGSYFSKKLSEALLSCGVIDLYKKAWQQNEYKFPLYFHPEGSIGAFGDNSYLYPSAKDLSAIATLIKRTDSPELKWLRQQWRYLRTFNHDDDPDPSTCMYDREYPPEEAYLPEGTPQDVYLRDIGWIAMHSDLEDPRRISLFFKSSEYGSFNHSHGDQNSFIIQAHGEPLAIDSGYYDLYGYPFDVDYTRQTHAHNAITHSNGVGQPIFDIMAKGKITDFLPGKRFSLAGGDSTAAYKGELKKALRHILFVKPHMFIVIDELEAADNETTFEFWLNAQKDIQVYDDKIEITKDNAVLDVRLDYPEKLKVFKSDTFSGTDSIPHLPLYSGYVRWPVQKRIWAQTERVNRVNLVTSLNVGKGKEEQKQYGVKKCEDSIIYTIGSDTRVYINTGSQLTVDGKDISFTGTAAVFHRDGFMLVNGTRLCAGGNTLVSADKNVSVSVDGDELFISSIQDDSKINIFLPDIMGITDDRGNEITGDSDKLGITADGVGNFSLYNGTYALKLLKENGEMEYEKD